MKGQTGGRFLLPVSMTVLIGLCSFVTVAVAAQPDEVALATYLRAFARDNHIEIEGLERIGADTFRPPATPKSVDKTLRRALARYNTIEYYGENGIVRVTILGRKGSSIGALPDEVPYVEPAPDPESQ